MRVRVSRSKIKGNAEVPPSKSLTHRALILSSIIPGVSIIHTPLLCEDTKATIDACRKIGADIEVAESITVHGVAEVCSAGTINVNNSGTTLRLMAGVCALAPGKTTLTGDSSILNRPMLPLLDSLENLGAECRSRNGLPPVTVSGPLVSGRTKIGGESSQFVSSLLIASLKTEKQTEIEITSLLKSRPYLDLTIDVIRKAGGKIEEAGNILRVPANQDLHPLNLSIEPDLSSASFLLAAGAIAREVEVTLNPNSLQGDKKILDILRQMGAEVELKAASVCVRKHELTAITADLSDTPDLLPIVSVLMSLAQGKSRIVNAEHTRKKESDRIAVMAEELTKLGGKVSETPDGLEIEGVKELRGICDSHGDHRVAMALMVAGLSGSVQVDRAECTGVSFPGFVDCLRSIRGNLEVAE